MRVICVKQQETATVTELKGIWGLNGGQSTVLVFVPTFGPFDIVTRLADDRIARVSPTGVTGCSYPMDQMVISDGQYLLFDSRQEFYNWVGGLAAKSK